MGENENAATSGPQSITEETASSENTTYKTIFNRPTLEFALSDGSVCVVKKPKGKHQIKGGDMALLLYGKSPTGMQVMGCILSLITTINGEGISVDALEDLWAEDFNKIQNAYIELTGGF